MPKNAGNKNRILRPGVKTGTAAAFVGAAVLCLLLFGILSRSTGASPFLLGGILILVYGGLCVLAYFLIERRSQSGALTDETLEPMMGRIMYDAVVRMASPAFICNMEEQIVWANRAAELLLSDGRSFRGRPFYSLFGVTLADIRSAEGGCRMKHGERVFLAHYNHIRTDENDFSLIMTSEITEQERLSAKMEGDEPVVAYLIIDNLSEMLQYDGELYRPAAAEIDEILRDWAEENGGILREYERDKYLFITDQRTLDKLVAGRFEVLDRVRNAHAGETGLSLTVSIGVSSAGDSFEEKEKAARAALDMALQRGGDQAVVKGDRSIDFFGGITKSVQRRTNVRARVFSAELITAMKSASNVLIMGHGHADFDAFGSAVGLATIPMASGIPVRVVVDLSDRNLIGCRAILSQDERFDKILLDREDALDHLETGTLVIMTDVNNLAVTEVPELATRTEKLAIIDHHRKTAEFEREPDVEYIDPSASSASELVAEMLEQVLAKDDCTAAVANLLLAGITLDTHQFTNNTGTRTFSAAMYLRDRGADPAMIRDLFRESLEDYRKEARFRSNVEIYRDVCAITVVDDPEATDRVIAAKAANNLLMVDGIRASFALMRAGDTVHISARSSGTMNVQLIMEELSGGGHYDAAAAQCVGKTMEETLDDLRAAIDKHL